MNPFRYACPHCRCGLDAPASPQPQRCPSCGTMLALSPAFLATSGSKLIFLAVAALVGSTVSGVLVALGLPAATATRVLAGAAIGVTYYLLCRGAYTQIHQPIAIDTDSVPGKHAH